MRKVLSIVGAMLVAVPLLLVAALVARTPKARPPSSEKVQATPERIARGAYLAEHVSGCVECHSEHDYRKLGGPETGPRGAGGLCLTEEDGFPGHVCAPNITSDPQAGIGAWSDGEVMRAIREGISRDGRTLIPVMPYGKFRSMSDEDLRSVVVYVRTLPPSSKRVPPPSLRFPVNLLMRMAPQPVEGEVQAPLRSDRLAYGGYLATIAGCEECHTPQDKGKPVPGMRYAGGMEMRGAWGRVVAANITPDEETGIGRMSRAEFITRFQAMAAQPVTAPAPAGENSVMPWRSYGGMSSEDLGMIYDFLRTVPKVHHAVTVFPDVQAKR